MLVPPFVSALALVGPACSSFIPVIIIVMLATTPRGEMHPPSKQFTMHIQSCLNSLLGTGYVFGKDGIVNASGSWPTGIAFLFGLLSVQWTVSILRRLPSYIDSSFLVRIR